MKNFYNSRLNQLLKELRDTSNLRTRKIIQAEIREVKRIKRQDVKVRW